MGYARKDVEKTKKIAKKFVRYQEGAEPYSIGLTKFQELAKEAKVKWQKDTIRSIVCFVQENLRELMDIIHIVGLPDQGKETV